MALTLLEAAKQSNNVLQAGVIEKLAKDDPVLERLPFKEIVGNGLTYNVQTSLPSVEWHDDLDEWVESVGSVTPLTAVLKILGGDADISEFAKATRSNVNDLRQEVLNDKIMALRQEFGDAFYYGSSSSNSRQFDGLQTLIADTTYNTVHAGSDTGTALSCAKLDEALDLVKAPVAGIMMSKKTRRLFNTYLRSLGAFSMGIDEFGKPVQTYNGHPVWVSDYVRDTETASSGAYSAKTGGSCTTIFIMSFGPQAICGLQNGTVTTVPLGQLKNKDAERIRIKWYCSLMFQNIRTAAKVDGILTSSAVTA